MIICTIFALSLKKHSRAISRLFLLSLGLPRRTLAVIFIIPFFFLSLIVSLPLSSYGMDSSSSLAIKKAAYRLARDLVNTMEVAGKTIQVSENNFWERDTKINLPFSSVLRDAMAAALSKREVTVTVQEAGDEPLRLMGTYAIEGDDAVITVRIRSMGETASKDLSVVQTKVHITNLDSGWFRQEFSRVARTIVRVLEDNYHGLHEMDVTINPLQPGLKGQPPLLLGREFQKFLESAVAGSALFRASGISFGIAPATMQGTYSRLGGQIRLHVWISGSGGRTITSAVFDVEVAGIPPDLLMPVAEKLMRVCTVYTPVSSTDPLTGSPAGDTLLGYITEALVRHGIKTERCSAENRDCIRTEVQMKLRENCTEDGYGIASGQLQIKVFDSSREMMGKVYRREKSFFRNNLEEGAEDIIQKIFKDEKLGAELAGIILAR
jgi:hypothetical protein